MHFSRLFTRNGQDPFNDVEVESRHCRITNMNGASVFEMDVLVPVFWSHNATSVVAQKYLRKAGVPSAVKKVPEEGIPSWCQRSVPADDASFGSEIDIRQALRRMAGTWTYWGFKMGLFSSEEDGRVFYDEACYTLVHQMWAPNSPQWFNTGLHWAYGIEGPAQGHYYVDPKSNELVRSKNAYERPQPHACFIQSVRDDLVGDGGIMDLWVREARLFKYGSGTGTNFSTLRGAGERLSGGGVSSGVMSWLRIGDRSAQGIQSGGTTRRAAKMVVLDDDHPEICEFVNWKVAEEQKVAAMVAGSRACEKALNAIVMACRSVDEDALRFDPKSNSQLGDAVLDARQAFVPDSMIYRAIELAKQGVTRVDFPIFDTDWQGVAYDTVSGQQSNNSISISQAFLEAVEGNKPWDLTRRTDGTVMKTIPASSLWADVTYAAWACADPGVQFNSTMNEWHTCLEDDRIRATNPCSEYVFIDDTACNLASLNLVLFEDDADPGFGVDRFVHVVKLVTTVLEISVAMSQLPSPEIARKTYDYRTLGLGYANLGALLMRRGLAYDSVEARGFAAALTAIMTGEAYAQSARLADQMGPFPRFQQNKSSMMRVIYNHMVAARGTNDYDHLSIEPRGINDYDAPSLLTNAARSAWESAYRLGLQHGYRNAQVTALAPTGTISISMDCDTTGIEPDFALVKFKSLAGGGGMTIINQSVPVALRRLGYSAPQVDDIVHYVSGHREISENLKGFLKLKGFNSQMLDRVSSALQMGSPHLDLAVSEFQVGRSDLLEFTDLTSADLSSGRVLLSLLGLSDEQISQENLYAVGTMTIEGAPHIQDAHLAVFDCANRCGLTGKRFISPRGHVDMMGSIQPFVSGAISKTVNMPRDATLEDVRSIYHRAWKLGLKAVALYRDGSKLSQPLGSRLAVEIFEGLERSKPDVPVQDVVREVSERMVVRYLSERRKLPFKRRGYTQKVVIGGHKMFLRTGEYEDGTLGELFIDTHKEGAAFRSLLAAFAMAVSVGLQHGVPLEKLVDLYTFTKYEPNGPVYGDAQVRSCTSLLDWVFRHLAVTYLGREDLAHVKKSDLEPDSMGEPDPVFSHEKTMGVLSGSFESDGLCDDEDTSEVALHHTWMLTGASSARSEGARSSSASGVMSLTPSEVARVQGYEGEPCDACGQLKLVRTNGNCTKCVNCGEYGGCS